MESGLREVNALYSPVDEGEPSLGQVLVDHGSTEDVARDERPALNLAIGVTIWGTVVAVGVETAYWLYRLGLFLVHLSGRLL
jgi:hypothetical protein